MGATPREDATMLGKKAHAVVLLVAALALVAAGLYGVKLLRDSTSAETGSSDTPQRSRVVLRDSVLTTVGPAAKITAPKDRVDTGRLRLVGGCLGLDRQLVVWPTDTTWDAKKKRLKVPGAAALPLGATLRVTGRPLTASQLTQAYGKDALRHVRSCRGGTSVTILDPAAKVRRLDHRKYVL